MIRWIVLIILTLLVFAPSTWGEGTVAPVLRFGGDQLIDPAHLLASEGEVFVVEPKLFRITIFTHEGKFKMNLGREGEGPGEFKLLNMVNITNGMIYCYDMMGRKIHLFSQKNKKYLKSTPFTNTVYGHPPMSMAVHPDGMIVMFNSNFTKDDMLIGLYTPEGELIKRFFNAYPAYKSRNEFLEYLNRHGHSKVDQLKNAGYIAVYEGNIYFANFIENMVIEMDMNGRILNRYSFPLPSHEKTLTFYTVEGKHEGQGRISYIKNRLNYALRSGNDGVYILSRDSGISYIFRLAGGTFREVCRMKEPLISFDIMNNKVYCLADEPEDEKEGDRVLVYDIPGN